MKEEWKSLVSECVSVVCVCKKVREKWSKGGFLIEPSRFGECTSQGSQGWGSARAP